MLNDDFERAYAAGKLAGKKFNYATVEIVEPQYERLHAARYAEAMKEQFWRGVRDELRQEKERLQRLMDRLEDK